MLSQDYFIYKTLSVQRHEQLAEFVLRIEEKLPELGPVFLMRLLKDKKYLWPIDSEESWKDILTQENHVEVLICKKVQNRKECANCAEVFVNLPASVINQKQS